MEEQTDAKIDDSKKDEIFERVSKDYYMDKVQEAVKEAQFKHLDEDALAQICYIILKKQKQLEEKNISSLNGIANIRKSVLIGYIVKYIQRKGIDISMNEIESVTLRDIAEAATDEGITKKDIKAACEIVEPKTKNNDEPEDGEK